MSGHRHTKPRVGVAERFRCTTEQWRTLRDLGIEMMRQGKTKSATPLRAYSFHRYGARERQISFDLTLWQWWTIWRDSGHWDDRGPGRGYVMCRYGDVGPYAVGNVFIGPGVENTAAAHKKNDLPIGVTLSRSGKRRPYEAHCNVGGKTIYLGRFPTVAEAEVAYLAARDFDVSMRKAA